MRRHGYVGTCSQHSLPSVCVGGVGVGCWGGGGRARGPPLHCGPGYSRLFHAHHSPCGQRPFRSGCTAPPCTRACTSTSQHRPFCSARGTPHSTGRAAATTLQCVAAATLRAAQHATAGLHSQALSTRCAPGCTLLLCPQPGTSPVPRLVLVVLLVQAVAARVLATQGPLGGVAVGLGACNERLLARFPVLGLAAPCLEH